ncbi:16S rRNA (guanine(966)-N(2))-methyltransferase RsmD [Subtercola boreus]|uniref:16S rRNA (Guanine(966)-N(2))-methyltransferase RsmD n=1 Tax=Subtercola boreus TaxID=120213 RepID=A0A3E0WDN4_9MICO|nr:16S rRNA (guanine(966)-N(2))-methyltransferase RsmD [Subtercola boreus]RFA22391.1 16S rRNA (guanine(966)-N(2))-methyltransferase RsmD [Subtercola boreus]RFA22453.1 16S rRNA (guanine(966)-N(2))-methyltransferase RsmD [Subtercola boreus]RFA28468.1 16S rRNA (guanine(966)-N(2))-methyltransferase RsmD [Subtercola boreus]
MTRIIAGFAGSQRLAVPPTGTRPTSDRVREAIFSALDARGLVGGSAVLDLYAGSGALGLEAASRGAAEVTLVEKNPGAARVAKNNVAVILKAASGSKPRIRVATQTVAAFLASTVSTFDVVFVDPPYDLSEAELADGLRMLGSRVTPGAVIVVERTSRSPEPSLPPTLELERRKDYGETTLWWLTTAE